MNVLRNIPRSAFTAAVFLSGCGVNSQVDQYDSTSGEPPVEMTDGGTDAPDDVVADVRQSCDPLVTIGNTSGNNVDITVTPDMESPGDYAVGFYLGNNDCTPVRFDEVTFRFDAATVANFPGLSGLTPATSANYASVEFINDINNQPYGQITIDDQAGTITVSNIGGVIPTDSNYAYYDLYIHPNSCGIAYDYKLASSADIKFTSLTNGQPIADAEKMFSMFENGGPRYCQ